MASLKFIINLQTGVHRLENNYSKGMVAGYYRLSVEDGSLEIESNSISSQRLLVKKYIASHKEFEGYGFCEFYDDGYSGTTMDRPGIQKLLAGIKDNKIQCVIVKDISRFSRDYIELGTYMEQVFPFMQVRFIAITDHYDSNNPAGSVGVGMDIAFKSLLSDFYCKDVSDKVKSSLEARKKQGKYATGSVPFGYMKNKDNPQELLIVQEEAEVIKRIFSLSLEGNNLTKICKILNDGGVKTPLEYKNARKKQDRKELMQGHKYWQPAVARTILTNETYTGSMVYNKSEQAGVGQKKKILKPRSEWKVFPGHHAAIIDRETFDRVQGKFFHRKETGRTPFSYPLKGKVYCAYCNRCLRVTKLSGGRLSLYCANRKLKSGSQCIQEPIRNDWLESVVLKEIQLQLGKLKNLDIIMKETSTGCKGINVKEKTLLEKLEQDTGKLIQEKADNLEEYHKGLITKEELLARRDRITGQIVEIKKQQKELEEKVCQGMEELQDKEKKQKEYSKWSAYYGLDVLSRKMAEAFISKVVIDNQKNISIFWMFSRE